MPIAKVSVSKRWTVVMDGVKVSVLTVDHPKCVSACVHKQMECVPL